MTESSNDPRPELHDECKSDLRRGACRTYPITCRDQQELWDSGYAAGRAAVLGGVDDARRMFAEDLECCARHILDAISDNKILPPAPGCPEHDVALLQGRAEAAEAKLAELMRSVRELEREPRMGGPNFTAIMRLVAEYDPKPERGA